MKHRRILDLCGGTGAWSAPYVEAGYTVELVDLPNDVRLLEAPGKVHGILAAPPCTYFARVRAPWGPPTSEQLVGALSVVDACLRLVMVSRPVWWALENPIGSLAKYIGPPVFKFDPWQFGDPWTKRTWIWGEFTPPMATVSTTPTGSLMTQVRSVKNRARTPAGFARAFFESNP